MSEMLSTKQVAKFLNINEKMVYSLIAEKGLPASKVTGKWLFPKNLVLKWIESGTQNFPQFAELPEYHGLVLIAGSNDLLLDKMISTFNLKHENHMALFGMAGSMGGINALKRNRCHMAASHMTDETHEYNFPFIKKKLKQMPAVVNFCKREQGLLIQKGNPKKIKEIKSLANPHVRIVNRPVGTGTRALFDQELKSAGLKGDALQGYDTELSKHMDVGYTILSGKADAGPGIRPVATVLGLDFIPICWERFDLLINRNRFFDPGVQYFLSMLKGKMIQSAAEEYGGYDLSITGKMVYPEPESE